MSTPIPTQTKEYISLVTDPYHDRNLRVSGFPDGQNMTSVVRRLAYQTTIACPFALVSGESWDFHIFATPLHQEVNMYSAAVSGNTFSTSGAASKINTLNVFYRKYDTNGGINGVHFASIGQPVNAVSSNDDGPGRTVSLAFELHNTTAEMYKSGSITCYRTNALSQRCDLRLGTTTPPMGFTADIIQNIPSTLAQAQMIPNSRTWEAARGIYSVCLPPKNNEYKTSVFNNILININHTSSPFLAYIASYVNNATLGAPAWSPLHCTGVMSSRFMDTSQTFTLDMRQVLEYFPNSVSSTLLPFATTAPEADRLFLKMYQQMINRIEPGVPVDFNSAGEWFRRIIQLAKETLPTLQHLIPPQYQKYTAAIGPVADKAADIVLDLLGNNKAPPPTNVTKNTPTKKNLKLQTIKLTPAKRKKLQILRFQAGNQRMIKAKRA